MADIGTMIREWRCRRLAAALVDYAAGKLEPPMRRRIEAHLDTCAACAAARAALDEVPPAVHATAPIRDDAFWRAQRDSVMQAIGERPARAVRTPLTGFDWRLALPIAAALAIGLAGYLSLRPPEAPGEIALDALPGDDLSALIEVAGGILPTQELPPVESRVDEIGGAVDAGWVDGDDLPPPVGWGELDDGEIDALHGLLG
jgi:anti-sigma factor RsiW